MMGIKKIYNCNLCGHIYERSEANKDLLGLSFSGMRKFQLGGIDSTDGYHICKWCAAQVCQQAPSIIENMGVSIKEQSHDEAAPKAGE